MPSDSVDMPKISNSNNINMSLGLTLTTTTKNNGFMVRLLGASTCPTFLQKNKNEH